MRKMLLTFVVIFGFSPAVFAEISCDTCFDFCNSGCASYQDPAQRAACASGCMRGCVLADCTP